MKWVLCDIDGTVSDASARQYLLRNAEEKGIALPWDLFHEAGKYDPPIQGMVDLINLLNKNYGIAFITARPEKWRAQTVQWLDHFFKFQYALYMREKGNFERSSVIKHAMMTKLLTAYSGDSVLMAFDDNPAVVKMYRDNGVLCLQPGEEG